MQWNFTDTQVIIITTLVESSQAQTLDLARTNHNSIPINNNLIL